LRLSQDFNEQKKINFLLPICRADSERRTLEKKKLRILSICLCVVSAGRCVTGAMILTSDAETLADCENFIDLPIAVDLEFLQKNKSRFGDMRTQKVGS